MLQLRFLDVAIFLLLILMNVARNMVQMLRWDFFSRFGVKMYLIFLILQEVTFTVADIFFHMLPILCFHVTLERRSLRWVRHPGASTSVSANPVENQSTILAACAVQ